MKSTKFSSEDNIVSILFIIVALLFVIIGILFFTYDPEAGPNQQLSIINFIGIGLLAIGFSLKKEGLSNKIKIAGWGFTAFFWATQINNLYLGEEGDFVNAFFCAVGVCVLIYIAYHEWLSIKLKDKISCLNWLAGAAVIAGIIYSGIELTPLEMWLREVVAAQSAWVLSIFTGDVVQEGIHISWELAHIEIIFACTAVQSMVLFVGIILPLPNVDLKRKIYGLLVTVLPVYFLNLFRNALVTYLTGVYGSDFFPIAHNVIAKGLGLVALIILLFIVIKIIPEILDEIICLTDLHKRNGPIEKFVKKLIWRKQ